MSEIDRWLYANNRYLDGELKALRARLAHVPTTAVAGAVAGRHDGALFTKPADQLTATAMISWVPHRGVRTSRLFERVADPETLSHSPITTGATYDGRAQTSRRTPVAQYIRMSNEHQRFSPDNQATVNAAYAIEQGYEIVATYQDLGKSGLDLKARPELKKLLSDVLSGVCHTRPY